MPFSSPYLVGVSAALFPSLGAFSSFFTSPPFLASWLTKSFSFGDHPGLVCVQNLRVIAQPLVGGCRRPGAFLSMLRNIVFTVGTCHFSYR